MNRHQKEVDELFKERGWPYWDPLAVTARLYEEGGEFARLMNHLHGSKKKKAEEVMQDVEEEIGDIIFTLICYANPHGFDLDKAVEKSIAKVRDRDKNRYPREGN